VHFFSTELDAFAAEDEFDAIIGRLILMYLPNPAETLRRLCHHLRPDGRFPGNGHAADAHIAERLGVVAAAEAEIETMAERLRNEAVQQNSSIMTPPFIEAWVRAPV
jgi:SAM-dependent methyltransferase